MYAADKSAEHVSVGTGIVGKLCISDRMGNAQRESFLRAGVCPVCRTSGHGIAASGYFYTGKGDADGRSVPHDRWGKEAEKSEVDAAFSDIGGTVSDQWDAGMDLCAPKLSLAAAVRRCGQCTVSEFFSGLVLCAGGSDRPLGYPISGHVDLCFSDWVSFGEM